jgi:drug/metabolite transporter (DMT)-like permease
VIAAALALASSVVWGLADFGGGSAARRLPLLSVTVLSQAAGLVALAVAVIVQGGSLDRHAALLGLVAGVGGAVGLAAFYRALALGTMSVVSPIVACSAVVPLVVALASGERPSGVALGGSVLALGGAILASVEEHASGGGDARKALAAAVVAMLALGIFVTFLGRAGHGGETLSALVGARVGSFGLLALAAVVARGTLRLSPRDLGFVALVGLLDVAANALFTLAAARGLLSVVSVLGSLYPVTTVLLAHILLGERLTGLQRGGVAAAIVGAALASAG